MLTQRHFWISGLIFACLLGSFVFIYKIAQREIVYQIDFADSQSTDKVKVSGLIKNHALEQDKDGSIFEVENWTMTQDQVELTVIVPDNFKDYSKLVVEAEFQNPDNPTLEVGVRKQIDIKMNEPVYGWQYHYLDHKYLNQYKKYLGTEWTYVEDSKRGLILFQKEKQYNSVEEFRDNPPGNISKNVTEVDEYGVKKIVNKEVAQIMTVDYILKQNYKFSEFNNIEVADFSDLDSNSGIVIAEDYTRIPYSFRGNFNLYVYIDNQEDQNINISFIKQDLNHNSGEDFYEIKVYDYKNQLVAYDLLMDDGIIDNSGLINIQQHDKDLKIAGKGLYLVKFIANSLGNDTVIRNLQINSGNVLINNFNVVDNEFTAENMVSKPLSLYALKSIVTFQVIGQNYEQNVYINDAVYYYKWRNYAKNPVYLTNKLNKITTTLNGLIIEASAPMSFAKETLFNIEPHKTMEFKMVKNEDNNYVIANYRFPDIQNEYANNNLSFNINDIYIDDDNQIRLLIQANGLQGYGNTVKLGNISVKLSK